ncbi:MAG TPA: glycosyltransferase [Acidobacteriota bacterium]|nr:glycosyltransferase [Acidobacteriota bacterium]
MIPNLFHFVFGLKPQTRPFHLVFYLCLESCRQVNQPEQIFFYYHHEPFGAYWELIRPHLTLVKVDPSRIVSQHRYDNSMVKKFSYAHHADFIRLEKLLARGGVYADIDTLFVNPIPPQLFSKPFVIGREADVVDLQTGRAHPSLCNAFLMAEPQAAFGRRWLTEMATVFNGEWSRHSCQLAWELSQRDPDEVHIEPERTFYKHPFTREGIATLFERFDPDVTDVVSFHLWAHLWWDRSRRDFSTFHAGKLTYRFIKEVDTTYTVLARKYLPLAPEPTLISKIRHWLSR